MVIAAGTYGNQAFKSGIQVTGDTVIEGNETILMSVGPHTNYTLAGISASGAAAKTSTTAPIVDDDLDLIATKTATVTSAANAKMSPLPFASAMRGQFQPPT